MHVFAEYVVTCFSAFQSQSFKKIAKGSPSENHRLTVSELENMSISFQAD